MRMWSIPASAALALTLGLSASVLPAPFTPAPATAAAAVQQPPVNTGSTWLERLNWLRASVGVPPVREDPELSRKAALHANYMAINDDLTHDEDPSKPGYTPEGAQAGKTSNVTMGYVGMTDLEMLDTWATAPFHTIGLLRPQVTAVGYARKANAHGRDYSILTVLGAMNGPYPRDGWPRVYPNGPGQPYAAYPGTEWPDPIAPHCDQSVRRWGVPIIADWGQPPYGRPPTVTQASAELFANGQPVRTCVALAKDYAPNSWALGTQRVIVLAEGAYVNGVQYTGSVKTNLGTATINFSVQVSGRPTAQHVVVK